MRIPAIFFVLSFGLFLGLTRHLFIFGDRILRHENLGKVYPLYYFAMENLFSGHFPYWNPYSHAGEPFYPILGQVRLFDPLTLATLLIGSLFTRDSVLLFNWTRLAQTVVIVLGTYLLLCRWAKALPLRLSLIAILFFSSFSLGAFQQDGIISQFLWVPFFLIFFFRIVADHDYRWSNWAAAAGLCGLNWQSYFFSGPLTFVIFFLAGLTLSRGAIVRDVLAGRRNRLSLALSLGIVGLMMAPDLALLREQGRFVFPERMIPADHATRSPLGSPEPYEGAPGDEMKRVALPYSAIVYTGSFSTIWDYLQMVAPSGNGVVHADQWMYNYGQPTEAFLYLGQLTVLLALIGFFRGHDPFKRAWALTLVGFGLLTLGPAGGLHRVLYPIFPPLWFVRHTHAFVLFVQLGVLYFYVLGYNAIAEGRHRAVAPYAAMLAWLLVGLVTYPVRSHFLLFTATFLVIPALACWKFPSVARTCGLVTLCADLLVGFLSCGVLTRGEPHPAQSYPYAAAVQPPAPPQPRAPYATPFPNGMRSTSLLLRRSSALTEPVALPAAYTFAEALREKRLGSFLLLDSYFTLIHSGIAPAALEAYFAIGKPPFQGVLRHEVRDYSHNHFTLDVTLAQSGTLYWSDGYDPNWHAYEDDREIPITRANGNFKAIALPPGEHRLRLEYDPIVFRWALILFYAVFIFAMGFPLADAVRSSGGRVKIRRTKLRMRFAKVLTGGVS